ncbi:MAG: hypothetical protein V3U80_07695, partial [Flavobacteriaceae bacterium]
MNFLETTKGNIIIALATAIITFIIMLSANLLKNTGMAALVLMWFPFVFALGSIILYFIINQFIKKGAWIAVIIGVILNITFLLNLYFNNGNT